MALTPAERAKRYRDKKKQSKETHEEYLKKERERYRKRKQSGEFDYSQKSAHEMNLKRRKWRVQKRERREKKKAAEVAERFLDDNSPVSSEEQNQPIPVVPQPTHQANVAKKRQKRHRAKVARKVKKLEKEKDRYKKLYETARKRVQRMSKKQIDSKAKLALQRRSSKKTVVTRPTQRIKLDVKEISRQVHTKTGHTVSWTIKMRRKVRLFLEEDVNSTQAPGKKDTITRGKIKMQKRYLNDTLLNLCTKFISENPDCQMSYVTFTRLRPFWIVQKKIGDRDTCLCKLHENTRYRIEKLYKLGVVKSPKPDEVLGELLCDVKSKDCAYGDCVKCKETTIKHTNLPLEQAGTQIKFEQWSNRTETIFTKEGNKNVNKTVKVEEQDTLENLIKETTVLLKQKYGKHVLNIQHQHKVLKDLKSGLRHNEALIHVDFSENYSTKLSSEIQSMHFGGSRSQISLHTVVVYTKDNIESFCTVSACTAHGPGAIWAHLNPIINYLKESYPNVTDVHFVSDGPCTQYMSKNNFYMFHQEILENYDSATWNFTESGHGKSAADGIGGTVKRTADRIVAQGTDIPDTKTFINQVNKNVSGVRLFEVNVTEIEKFSAKIPKDLQTIKGTLKLHQVTICRTQRGILNTRELSCFCYRSEPEPCSCHGRQVHHIPEPRRVGATTEAADLAAVQSIDTLDVSANRNPSNTEDSNPSQPAVQDKLSPVIIDSSSPAKRDTQDPTNLHTTTAASALVDVNPGHDLDVEVGDWVVVKYDKDMYPGIIQEMDDTTAEVKCMCKIGPNRFFWPRLDDVIWYNWSDILAKIPEPLPVTRANSRHLQVDNDIWTFLQFKLK